MGAGALHVARELDGRAGLHRVSLPLTLAGKAAGVLEVRLSQRLSQRL